MCMTREDHPCWGSKTVLWAVIASCFLTTVLQSRAETYTWAVETTGTASWSNPSTWSPNGVPGTGDDIVFTLPGSVITRVNTEGSRTVNSIVKTGASRWEILNNTAGVASLTANTITGSSANFIMRNGSGGMTVSTDALNVLAGTTYFGATSEDSAQTIRGVTVTGTTSVSGGSLLFNVQNAATGNSYDLGFLDVSGAGQVTLANRAASTSLATTATANTLGLVGTGGTIQAKVGSFNTFGATLAINAAGDYSSGTILRDGTVGGVKLSVTKSGSGTQTLVGANTYTGSTVINEGALKIGDGGTTGSLTSDVNIAGSTAAFIIDRSNAYTFSNAISGVGQFVKMGGGTTTLSGSNSYTGGTEVRAGLLQVSNDANLGALSGTTTLNGGGLSVTGTTTFTRTLNLAVDSTFETGSNSAVTWSGVISGDGGLIKAGNASLTSVLNLTGTNTYTGDTVILAGVLGVESDANLGDAGSVVIFANSGTGRLNILQSGQTFNRGIVINEGSTAGLTVAGGMEATWAGTISGAGRLDKRFAGQLTLSGSNSYEGGTIVGTGTLRATHAQALGSGTVSLGAGTMLIVSVDSGAGTVSNTIVMTGVAGYALERAAGTSYSVYSASSQLSGGRNTTASLLAGTASNNSMLTTSFALNSTTAGITNDSARVSDVFTLAGTGTDVIVLQLAVADVLEGMFVGWLDSESLAWVNAIEGNSATGTSAIFGFAGSYAASGAEATADYLGSWGFDETNNTVWVMLDHNGEFTVVPEPGSVELLVAGLGVVFLAARRRRLASSP